jgi:hypothetical protein
VQTGICCNFVLNPIHEREYRECISRALYLGAQSLSPLIGAEREPEGARAPFLRGPVRDSPTPAQPPSLFLQILGAFAEFETGPSRERQEASKAIFADRENIS